MYWDSDEQELVGQILFLVRNKICHITKSQQQPAAIHLENSYFLIRINYKILSTYACYICHMSLSNVTCFFWLCFVFPVVQRVTTDRQPFFLRQLQLAAPSPASLRQRRQWHRQCSQGRGGTDLGQAYWLYLIAWL